MLYYEFLNLMDEKIRNQKVEIRSNPSFETRSFDEVETEFISLFNIRIIERKRNTKTRNGL